MQLHAVVFKRLDLIALLCLGLIAIGWFGMDALVVSFGRIGQNTRFYEFGVAMLHPAVLFVGVGTAHTIELWGFTLLTMATLITALAVPMLFPHRSAWLAGWLPLALMLICFTLLYSNGSSGQDAAAYGSGLRGDLMRLANHAMQRAERPLISHISIGAGGVFALLISLVLAVRSTLNFRASRELRAPLTAPAIIA
jgi:hypothetical protein